MNFSSILWTASFISQDDPHHKKMFWNCLHLFIKLCHSLSFSFKWKKSNHFQERHAVPTILFLISFGKVTQVRLMHFPVFHYIVPGTAFGWYQPHVLWILYRSGSISPDALCTVIILLFFKFTVTGCSFHYPMNLILLNYQGSRFNAPSHAIIFLHVGYCCRL